MTTTLQDHYSKMMEAFDDYRQEVETLNAHLHVLPDPPTETDMKSILYHQIAINLTLVNYLKAKNRYADELLNQARGNSAEAQTA